MLRTTVKLFGLIFLGVLLLMVLCDFASILYHRQYDGAFREVW